MIPSLPFLIPIVAIIMTFSMIMLALYLDYRKKRDVFTLHHQERLAAIEKGIEVPPLPAGLLADDDAPVSPRRNLLKGLIWSLIGLGLIAGLWLHDRKLDFEGFGLIPLGIGIAYLLYYRVAGPREIELYEAERRARFCETNPPPAV